MYDSLARASMNVNNRHSQRSEVECQADTQTPNGIQATALSVDAATTTASVKTAAASYRLAGIICPSSTIFSLLGKASLHSIFGLREAISSWIRGLSARITICWMCRLMQSQWAWGDAVGTLSQFQSRNGRGWGTASLAPDSSMSLD
jgi:hypothetical protein